MSTTTYEGASTGKRLGNWNPSSGGANALLGNNLPALRNRSRALHRNNPWINNGIERIVSNEIGTGIIPRSRCSNLKVRKKLEERFDLYSNHCDADGVVNFYGMQGSASRARNMSGEVFLRRRTRRASDGLPLNMQVQLIESDYVPLDHNRKYGGRNEVKQGIEFNRKGKRVAYWVHKEHPGEDSSFNFDGLIRVPAKDIAHHYVPMRPGAIRGEPICVQSMVKSYVFDKYDTHELTRKETQSLFTGSIKKDPSQHNVPEELDSVNHGKLVNPFSGNNDINVQAGTIIELFPGEDLNLFSTTDVGINYAPFMRQQLLAISAGLNIPYEVLTGDWEKTSDRQARFIFNEYRRGIQMIQDHFIIHQFCNPSYRWYVEAMVMDGHLSASDYVRNQWDYLTIEWQPQAWEYMHPEQDVNAKLKSIEGGLTSRQQEVAKRGYDAEEIDQQRYEDKQREEGFGLSSNIEKKPSQPNQ